VPSIALTVGANRVVRGIAIPTPIGKPDEEPESEYIVRKSLFELALQALATDIEEQRTFEV
jgi:glycine reductase